jgi:hypothetical protein
LENIQSKLNIQKFNYYLILSDAGKITGMIVDLGINEMIKLTNDRKQLDIIIDQAHELLKKND